MPFVYCESVVLLFALAWKLNRKLLTRNLNGANGKEFKLRVNK